MLSGKEEEFSYIAEHFMTIFFHNKLNNFLKREVDEKYFAPSVNIQASVEQREASLKNERNFG